MRNFLKSQTPTSESIETFGPVFPKAKRQRVPQGQRLAKRWPVLSAEKTPKFDGKNWNVSVSGLVENSITWSWSEFKQLPSKEQASDLHCVTTWSLLDQKFKGVAFKTILDLVKPLPEAKYVTFYAPSGYTSALPLADSYLLENDVLLAYEHNNQPLPPDHGGPLRSLVPQLYLWKSVKWLNEIKFTSEWERGFWEVRGYHQRADPWFEERYSSQEKVSRRDAKL